jgi:iron(II)-dependent oxidoreductase
MATRPRSAAQAPQPGGEELLADLRDARARTLELVHDLAGARLLGPRLDIVNPPLWEIGHVAWFHELFILRGLDARAPILPHADSLYDSASVAHDRRWELALPDLERTLAYLRAVEQALAARLERRSPSAQEAYRYRLTTFHEDMHGEALAYTRQTLGDAAPRLAAAGREETQDFGSGAWPGDAAVPGGVFTLGATGDERFVFDNEKRAHAVEIAPFRIARAPVTQAEYLAFVDDGGYRRRDLWSEEGWRWREAAGAEHPAYWTKIAHGGWRQRFFDRSVPLAPRQPVIHVNWHEAQAWCRWAGRRLPTEAEWEAAAAGEPDGRVLAPRKRRYPWGDDPPAAAHANLDGRRIGCADVAAHPAGDSAFGCRQMLGNVWEWTASAFVPYPGFAPELYREYSQPWFGTHKVLRGGCWATRSRMIGATYRNFFTPERRDIFAGFRTCAP